MFAWQPMPDCPTAWSVTFLRPGTGAVQLGIREPLENAYPARILTFLRLTEPRSFSRDYLLMFELGGIFFSVKLKCDTQNPYFIQRASGRLPVSPLGFGTHQ